MFVEMATIPSHHRRNSADLDKNYFLLPALSVRLGSVTMHQKSEKQALGVTGELRRGRELWNRIVWATTPQMVRVPLTRACPSGPGFTRSLYAITPKN